MDGEVPEGSDDRVWSVGAEEHPLPESVSSWRVHHPSTPAEVKPRSEFTRDRSPPKRAGTASGRSRLLDPSVQTQFRRAVQCDFRRAAQSMLQSLVSEHEQIFSKHLQLVIKEQQAALHDPDENVTQTQEMLLVGGLTWVDVAAARLTNETNETYSSKFQLVLLFARLLRVVRVFRVRAFNELFMMVNGAIGSCKTLLYSLVLISLPLYCVSLVLTETLGRSAGLGAEKFARLEDSIFTVFRCFVAGDCTQEEGKPLFVLLTHCYGWAYGVLYCVVQFGMTFGLYNVITAIYVEKSVAPRSSMSSSSRGGCGRTEAHAWLL